MMEQFRCQICGKLLAKVEVGSKVEIKCPKCKTLILFNDHVVEVLVKGGYDMNYPKVSPPKMAFANFNCDYCEKLVLREQQFCFWEKGKRICVECAEDLKAE